MIITKLRGGLGNQMFQYALGRQLSIINKTSLKLDLTQLEERPVSAAYVVRDYELGRYKLKAKIAEKKDIAVFKVNTSLRSRVLNSLKKKLGIIKVIDETGFEFQQAIFSNHKNIYLDGYWQSEKYFDRISALLREEFTLKNDVLSGYDNNESLSHIADKITKINSVAVHYRRGDYVKDPLLKMHYAECSEGYYKEAVSVIKNKTGQPQFFIFSDDPDWLKTNSALAESGTIIENNPAFVDLYLMSLCKHNIIANSSFSWWGAWLNRNPEKIVIAPRRWFADDEANKQTKDLIPDKWIRL